MKVSLKKIFKNKDLSLKSRELANIVDKCYKDKELVVIGIMNGAFFFMSDFIKNLSIDFQFDTISCSSYFGKTKSSGEVDYTYQSKVDLKGKNVLIIEDIVDTGRTIQKIVLEISKLNPKTVEIATLFLREKNKINHKLLWYGYKLKNEFIVGYGLDYDEQYRQLKDVYELTEIEE